MLEVGLRPRFFERVKTREEKILRVLCYGNFGGRWQATRRNIAWLVGDVIGVSGDRVQVREGVDGPGSILVLVPPRTKMSELVRATTVLEQYMPPFIAFRVEREA